MGYTQDTRSIAISTPLGKDKLLLKRCVITEQLGRPFTIKAELISEEPALKFLDIVGKAVTIRWRMPDTSGGDTKRYFSGCVSSFVQRPKADGFNTYEATIMPWLWFLTRTADCRIFHSAMSDPPEEMTVPGILKKVFKDHGFDDVTPALTATYRKMDHCVQYRETDFNFVSRLMEQEGIYYFFEHVDDGGVFKHKLKLVDAMSAHAKYLDYDTIKYCGSTADEDHRGSIISWSRIKQVQPGAYKVNDFDFKRPKTNLLGGGNKDRQHANSAFEIYDYSANFADEEAGDHGDRYGKLRMEELQAQHDILLGHSDCPGIACGSKFTLSDHPRDDENKEYLVVGVTYECTAEGYKSAGGAAPADQGKPFVCDFAAIPADGVFRPARVTEKPRIQGPQTAIVVGKAGEEILTDEFGRIKVQFHWDRYSPANENSPCWVRVSQLWAGKNWGGVFLPRIGQEVIVEFLDGNPDRPIVTGAVYNGESKPPYPLPDNATMSTIKSNSSKGGQGFNEIRFEDKKGSEQVFMHAEKDQDVRVKNDTKEWIGNDRHLIVKANQRELVEKDKHVHVKGDSLLKVDGNVGRTVAKDEIAKISGKNHLAVTGDFVVKVGGNLHEAITGNHHEKATGDLRLTSDANAYIKSSQNAAVESGMNVHVKGGMVVVIEAGMQLSLKAGANFIDIGPSGISISGTPLVNINTGGAAGSGSGAQAASPSSPSDPDAVTDASEAAKAEGGSSVTKTAPTPPQPKKFSSSAIALKEAANTAAPTVAEPPAASASTASPAATANAAAANANAATTTATTAASNATAAATSATSAAAAASASGASPALAAVAAAAGAAAGAAAAAAAKAAKDAAKAAKDAAEAAKDAAKDDDEDEDEEEDDDETDDEDGDDDEDDPIAEAVKVAKAAAKAAKEAEKAAKEAKAAATGKEDDKDDDDDDDDKDEDKDDDKDEDKDDEEDEDKAALKSAQAGVKAAEAAAKAASASVKAAEAAAKANEAGKSDSSK